MQLFWIVVLCVAMGVATAGTGAFLSGKYYGRKEAEVLKNPGFTVGVISEVRTYKGKGITVAYQVGNISFSAKMGVTDRFLQNHWEGDTTAVIYCESDPENAILRADRSPAK